MKKTLALALLLFFSMSTITLARVQYDSTGRKIIYDDTIRGQRRAEQAQADNYRKMQAAAAAKIDYEKLMQDIDSQDSGMKSNYYQRRN